MFSRPDLPSPRLGRVLAEISSELELWHGSSSWLSPNGSACRCGGFWLEPLWASTAALTSNLGKSATVTIVRPLGKDLMDEYVLNLPVAVGTGVADDDDAIVAICGVTNG